MTKVLVVDDDEDTLWIVQTILEKEGFGLVVARNGEEALERLRNLRPDLVLLDVMMPGLSGLDVLESLRSAETRSHLPVILMSAKCEERDEFSGYAAGADLYLTKPFTPEELLARIREVLPGPSAEANTPS